MNKKDLISFREPEENDLNFIFSSWKQSLRDGNPFYSAIDHDVYFEKSEPVIQSILSRPDCRVKIACLKDDPEVILGYCVFENKIVHWVYIKEVWRRIGLSSDLLPKDFDTTTHFTDRGLKILLKKYPNVKFNPFL
jgi:hypothetical protein